MMTDIRFSLLTDIMEILQLEIDLDGLYDNFIN